jgi:hypothetical protein
MQRRVKRELTSNPGEYSHMQTFLSGVHGYDMDETIKPGQEVVGCGLAQADLIKQSKSLIVRTIDLSDYDVDETKKKVDGLGQIHG